MTIRTQPSLVPRRIALQAIRATFHVLRSARPRLDVPRRSIVLALGAASLVVYWFGLIRPYGLSTLLPRPLADIAVLTRDHPFAQARFVLTIAALFGLYYLAWRACRPVPRPDDGALTGAPDEARPKRPWMRSQRGMWTAMAASLLGINLCMLWMYPIGAADLFDYVVRGRLTARYEGNPLFEPPRSIRQDPFFAYSAWPEWPSAYGPAWELLAAGVSRIAGDDVLVNVIAFKALGLAFYGGSVALVAGILRRRAPDRALQGVCLFAWNPLVVYETAGNGHNDIVMVFFILLAFFGLQHRRSILAAAGLTVGALVKFIPLLILPIVAAAGLRTISGWRARGTFLLKLSAACTALVVLSYAPFWRGGDLLGIQRKVRLFSTSLPAVLETRLEGTLGVRDSQEVVSKAALALTGLMVLAQTLRVWRDLSPPEDTGVSEAWLIPIRASSVILIFYLVVTCLWFQSWYALWPLALAALLPEGALGRTGVLLSYVAAWKTILFSFIFVPGPPFPTRLWRETRLAPATLGVVWLYVAYALVRARLTKRRSTHRRLPA